MCSHRIIPGLTPEKIDACDVDDDSSDHVEMKHHAIFGFSGYANTKTIMLMLEKEIVRFLRATPPPLTNSYFSHNATGWPGS